MFATLIEILKDIPVSAVLRERIQQYESDVLCIRNANCELEKKLADTEKELAKVKDEYIEYRRSHEQFVEVEGMKFQRLESGSYPETPRCINPRCHNAPLSVLPGFFNGIAKCPECGYMIHVTPDKIRGIVNRLNKEVKPE